MNPAQPSVPPAGLSRQALEAVVDSELSGYLEDLASLLRIPSVSALPEHAPDVRRAAEWVQARLRRAGAARAEVMETGGHPVVYAEWPGPPGSPTVLIYGHFDVQPPDPVERWTHPPFEPVVKDGRIYARGASDDKGNMLAPVIACELTVRRTGSLPLTVKFLIEGQEEIGSPQLPEFIRRHRELLSCDLVLSADGGQFSEEVPALTLSSRGLCALQIDVRGPASDLHSGVHGGAVQNPIHALAAILASLHDPDGRVSVEGFYDRVLAPTQAEREELAAVPFDEEAYRRELGVPALFGEAGYTTLERQGIRPTLEVNGVWGGFTGEGVKTVLPSEAHAKVTCRLVAEQDPDEVLERVAEHVHRHCPPGVTVEVRRLGGAARPYRMPADHPGAQAAREVLRELYGREPVRVRVGGTVPVYELFLRELGAYTVSFAFGLSDERIHAPDEFFRVASFKRAIVGYALLLQRLGRADRVR